MATQIKMPSFLLRWEKNNFFKLTIINFTWIKKEARIVKKNYEKEKQFGGREEG